ncbi:MAG: DUF4293 family protein [Rhodothermales bacterium]
MIQRIQSLYLLVGAILLLVMMFLDSLAESTAAAVLPWYLPAVLVLAGLAAAAALVAIFIFRDRPKQAKMVLGVQSVTLVCMIALYGGIYLAGDSILGVESVEHALLLLLPILAYIQFHLARRSIRKDIELIKSMDRLR